MLMASARIVRNITNKPAHAESRICVAALKLGPPCKFHSAACRLLRSNSRIEHSLFANGNRFIPAGRAAGAKGRRAQQHCISAITPGTGDVAGLSTDTSIKDLFAGYGAVVKIIVTEQGPDWINPWQRRTATHRTGSGVLVCRKGEQMPLTEPGDGSAVAPCHMILTAAHVVANNTFIQVQVSEAPQRHTAQVYEVLHESDLALLAVEDAEELEHVTPMTLSTSDSLPNLRDQVHVLGFPVGGDEVSITAGVVSRVEVQSYSHSHSRALAVTVDAAVNSGNSGGPVVDCATGDLIGIAFQGYAGSSVENQGHMVPTPLLKRFLIGVHRGNASFPSLGVHLQLLQSPVLRRKLQMDDSQHTGVLVARVEYGSSAWGVLQPGDVIMAIDNEKVQNDGSCTLYDRRLAFMAAVQRRFTGDDVAVSILRAGEEREERLVLKAPAPLVPRGQYDVLPKFAMVGGFLFQLLSLEFLQSWADWKDAPTHLVEEYYSSPVEEGRREVVVLTQVLRDEVNIGFGFESVGLEVVSQVNGQDFANMAEFVALCDQAIQTQEYVELKVGHWKRVPMQVVLQSSELPEADRRIRGRYFMPSNRSPHFPPPEWALLES